MRFLLCLLSFVLLTSQTLACPDFCYCYDDFVTCSDFTDLDLTLLPASAETLVLSQGEMEEIPPAFFARASNLKAVELNNFNARVVRGGAFRGLSNLDTFTIKGSSFDIVEPDGFSGVSGIDKFLISDCHFGRVGKHAFAEITDVLDWRMWSSYFASISDEAFYGIGRVHAIQLYQNNITYIGNDIFADAFEVEYVNFYMNTINVMVNGSISHIKEHADLLVIYANKFQCVCDNAWMTKEPAFEDYLTSNECYFASEFSFAESLFLISDVSPEVLCPVTSRERHGEVRTTLGTLPSVIEEVEIWSDHEGLNPNADTVQEHLYTGNVSVNSSVHESGMNLISDSESVFSSPSDSPTSPEWDDVTDSTLSITSIDFLSSSVDSPVESDKTTLDESLPSSSSATPPPDTKPQQAFSTPIASDSTFYPTTTDELFSSERDFSYDSFPFIEVSFPSFSPSLPEDDETSSVSARTSPKAKDFTVSVTEFIENIETVHPSSTPLADDISMSMQQDGTASQSLHGFSSSHGLEVAEAGRTLSSASDSKFSTDNPSFSSSLIPSSPSVPEAMKPMDHSSHAAFQTMPPTAAPSREDDSTSIVPNESTHFVDDVETSTAHRQVTTSPEPSTVSTVPSSKAPSSTMPPSSNGEEITDTPLASEEVHSPKENSNAPIQVNSQKVKLPENKKQVSIILDVITSKSTVKDEPTPTFPVELPFDLPENPRIASIKDKPLYDQAQIYALPYSTSAVGMKTEGKDSAICNVAHGYFITLSITMSFLLSRHFLS